METRRMCPHCRAFIKTSDRVCPYCEAEVGPRAIERRAPQDVLGGLIPHARFTTTIILLINFGLYAATAILSLRIGYPNAGMDISQDVLIAFGAKYIPGLARGEWWRLVTAGFLHGGLLHILMNSWVLFDLGAQVEEFYGTARFLVIYFISTVMGFYVSAYFSPRSVSIGASAGIFGLIGAMIALGVGQRTGMGSALRGFYIRWAVYGLILGVVLRFDNFAHLGGLAGGFAVAWLAGLPRLGGGTTERLWRIAAIVSVALTALSFVEMFLHFTSRLE